MNLQKTTKICSKCHQEKSINEFYFRKDHNTYRNECKKCHNFMCKQWDLQHLGRKKEITKNWELKNPKRHQESARRCYLKNSEKIKKRSKLWRLNNLNKFKKIIKKYQDKIYSTPQGKLNCLMSCGIHKSLCLNKNNKHWELLVNYTKKDLQKHLKLLFINKMTWKSFLKGLIHIHHLISRSSFKFKSEKDSEFKKCWALKNLVPMWKKDHIEFHKKYGKKTTKEQYDEFMKEKLISERTKNIQS